MLGNPYLFYLRHVVLCSIGSTSGFGNSGLKPSGKPVCVITGTTSGLGRETARALLIDGKYEVVMGCRNVDKMQQVANEEGFNDLPGTYKILPLDLGSFDSTR